MEEKKYTETDLVKAKELGLALADLIIKDVDAIEKSDNELHSRMDKLKDILLSGGEK